MGAMPENFRNLFWKGKHEYVIKLASGVWDAVWSNIYIYRYHIYEIRPWQKGIISITLIIA